MNGVVVVVLRRGQKLAALAVMTNLSGHSDCNLMILK